MTKLPPKGDLARKLAARTLEGRARLYHWLRLRYPELSKAKAELKYTWKDLAETVADAGALNAFGERPDAEAVRKAWLKLEQDMEAPKKAGSGERCVNAPDRSLAVSAPSRVAPVPTPLAERVTMPDDEPDDLPNRDNFRPAKLR
jgi:hypothetical protein